MASENMKRILESLGLGNLIEKFEAQDITEEVVQSLSDAQLVELGVVTLGKRHLIRSMCTANSSGSTSESAARAAVNAAFGYPVQQHATRQSSAPTSVSSKAPVASVVSEARSLVQSMSTSNRTRRNDLFQSSTGNRGKYGLPFRSNRPLKLSNTKGKQPATRIHQKRVIVLDYLGENIPEVSTLSDVMILVDGNIRYQGNDSEFEMRRKIRELMSNKEFLKDIMVDDFEFVRVSNKKIRKPDGAVPFDSLGINTVYPTGAIYVRLCKAVTLEQESDEEEWDGQRESEFASSSIGSTKCGNDSSSTSTKTVKLSDNRPSSDSSSSSRLKNQYCIDSYCKSLSSSASSDDEVLKEKLTDLFPAVSILTIEEAVSISITFEEAVDYILEQTEEKKEESSDALERSLKPLLLKLTIKPSITLRVDPQDLVSDAITFYKSSNFKPKQPIRIVFQGQPAMDSGGVKRQFYTDLFKELVANNQFRMFQGPSNRLLFNYDQTALNCGLFKMLGQIIAHSICQRCGGFPYLAPSMYFYLSTGDISQASAYVSVDDIFDEEEMNYVNKVVQGKSDEVERLNNEEAFVRLLQESGLTMALTDKNRVMVAQCLITHLVLGKRIASLDQFASGLDTLDVLSAIRANPVAFESLFVPSQKKMTTDSVKNTLKLQAFQKNCPEALTVFRMLLKYIYDSNENDLKKLLRFITGGEVLHPSGITVDVSATNHAIYASTCMCELVIPRVMAGWEYSDFKIGLSSAIDGSSFNCV